MNRHTLILFGLMLVMILASCSQIPAAPTAEIDNSVIIEEGYPVDIFDLESAYPGYPIAGSPSEMLNRGPDFKIDRPVLDGDNSLSGTGPAGVPIVLIDIFMGGELLGETIINDNGAFVFELSKPLIIGHTIGIKLGDLSNTGLQETDFIYNDTYHDVPLIGILFDMVVVQ